MRQCLVGFGVGATVIVGLFLAACSSSGPSSGSGSSSSSSGSGSGGDGSSGSADGGGPGALGALPATTFLFVQKDANDHDTLIAYDRASGQAATVTDFTGDGSTGWSLGNSYAISPDRTRIAVASLYGPTQADVDTKLAAKRIWSLAVDGSDFVRLTPVWQNKAAGRTNWQIEISDPIFSKNGANVFFEYGEYWYEGTDLQGAAGIWSVSAAGGTLPDLFRAPGPCSLVNPSIDPSTGKVAVIHSVCVPGQGQQDGIYLYDETGGGPPELLLARSNEVDVMLEPPRWVADGSGFVFIALAQVPDGTSTRQVRSVFVFDMQTRQAAPVVVPESPDARVIDAAAAPDASAIVYCLEEGDARNLHLIDLAVDPATDTALTNDGKSCHPVW